jgi:hypothetical protein
MEDNTMTTKVLRNFRLVDELATTEHVFTYLLQKR